jgi:tetratricopeptide (TPR) repeat protein
MDNSTSQEKLAQGSIDALVTLCQSGQLAGAEVQARDLLRDFPDNLTLNEILAGILAGQGRFQEALQAYRKAIEIKPDHGEAYFALGNILLYLGKPEEAMAPYGKVLDIMPGFAQAHANLGTALLGIGRGAEAMENLTKALELDPNLPEAHTNLGIALRNAGRTEEAVASFLKALQLEPGAAETHNNLGAAMEELGRLDEAIGCFRKAVGIAPGYAEAHCNLGNALAENGEHQGASESYRTALGIKPDFAEAHNRLGVSLKELGRLEDAEASLAQAIAHKPDFAQAHNNLATVLRRLGRLDDSAASCRTALKYDPRYAEAYYNLGGALQLDGQWEAAVAAYEKALEIKPDFLDAHSNIGHALQDLGRFAEAITHFDAAGNRVGNARALECCFALGRVEDYNKRLDELCGSDPTNIWAAGISTFVAHQWDMENPYSFCKDPLNFIAIKNVKSALSPFESFSTNLIKEIENVRTIWEPPENTTINGYHTIGNLFTMETPAITALRKVISQRIEEYRSIYADRAGSFISHWPEHSSLTGWHIKLVKDGYQESHIHPSGWLSGVIYLKMPANLDPEEGAITFTLHGRDYPVLNADIPSFRHSPKEGDLVLFPSSLFHYTSPFHSDGERLCVAFDLCPRRGATE